MSTLIPNRAIIDKVIGDGFLCSDCEVADGSDRYGFCDEDS